MTNKQFIEKYFSRAKYKPNLLKVYRGRLKEQVTVTFKSEFIMNFRWLETKEGSKFWCEIYVKLHDKEND